jgi:hypothetical protein
VKDLTGIPLLYTEAAKKARDAAEFADDILT